MDVRQAVLADIEVIAPLLDAYRRFYDCEPDINAARAFLRERFNHGQSVIFLASEGDVPLGFTQLYPSFSSVSLGRTFHLNDLFVVDGQRRKGVGARLLAAAIAHAKSLGAIRVTLVTDIGNKTAQATYEAEGWKRDQEFYVYHFLPGKT